MTPTTNSNALLLAEELLILLIDRKKGGLVQINDRNLRYAFAGAILMDLARNYRIDTDSEKLYVADTLPLGDDILDESLVLITQTTNQKSIIYWIEYLASPELIHRVRRRATDRLVNRRIFCQDPGGAIYLDKYVALTGRYPDIALPEGQDIILRVMNIIFSNDIPSPLETMLIALADACLIFERILTKEEFLDCSKRIELVGKLDLIGLSIRKAIVSVRKPEEEKEKFQRLFVDKKSAASRLNGLPPMMPGALPWVGHSLRLRPVPTKALAEYYQSYGPVFRIRDFGTELTVMAGPEANLFCQKNGRVLFRSNNVYTPLFENMDAQRIILSMDGEEHFKLRKSLSSGFHRDQYLSKLPVIQNIILGELPEQGSVAATDMFSQLTAKAIGLACTGHRMSTKQVDSMSFFLQRLIAATVIKSLPQAMMRTRRVRQAKTTFFDTFSDIINNKLRTNESSNSDVVDAMLDLYRSNPEFLPERELRVSCLGPIFSGLHTTASTGASAMYLLLKHPEIMEEVRTEADLFFNKWEEEGEISFKIMDVTKRTIMETLRLYNPFASIFRYSINTFDFGGYTIPVGTRILIPTSVPHFCSEFFFEPERFDIDRYLPDRAEHNRAGVYMPFGFGTHRCLGNSIADHHLLFALATILHHRNVAMEPSNYKMKIIFDGVPAPTRKFKLGLSPRKSYSKSTRS